MTPPSTTTAPSLAHRGESRSDQPPDAVVPCRAVRRRPTRRRPATRHSPSAALRLPPRRPTALEVIAPFPPTDTVPGGGPAAPLRAQQAEILDPALLPGLAKRGVGDASIARFEMPTELQPAADLAVEVEQDPAVVRAEHERGCGQVVRTPAAAHRVGHGGEWCRNSPRSRCWPSSAGSQAWSRRTASSVNGSETAVTSRSAGPAPTCPIRSHRCRPARRRPGRRGRRDPARGRGDPRRRRVPRCRDAPRAAPRSRAASRSRRGRSSRPTRVANVCSAGPPVARRRRTASRRDSAPAICVDARVTTMSTHPSTRASSVSSRASAAACAGVSSGSKTPDSRACWRGRPGRGGPGRRTAPGAVLRRALMPPAYSSTAPRRRASSQATWP